MNVSTAMQTTDGHEDAAAPRDRGTAAPGARIAETPAEDAASGLGAAILTPLQAPARRRRGVQAPGVW